MVSRQQPTWESYRASIGDRSEMFVAVADRWPIRRGLYPGSYVDLAPSVAVPDMTYVDSDTRAARYFADEQRVLAELAGRTTYEGTPVCRFVAADYAGLLPSAPGGYDLLVSLFAGPVWDRCRGYLRPGGLLLANTSHGDASLAALDPGLRLVAAVHYRDERYRLATGDLAGYLVPKQPSAADAAAIRQRGRGIAYTRSAFAYVFQAQDT